MLPVELARRDRVLETGEALGVVVVDTGDAAGSVKLMLRGSLSVPFLNSLGNEGRFSLTVDAGDADRGESIRDMETARWPGGRKVADEFNEEVEEVASDEPKF